MGNSPLTETNPTTARVNLYGNGLIRVSGEYPLTDGRGNVRLTLDGSRNVTSSNAPDAFGVGSATSGTASPYQWNGGAGYRTEGLAPTGLSVAFSFQKVGDRYYDPTLGCFLTRDTELGQKPYAYCDGDPVNFSDPSGHKPKKLPKPGQPNQGNSNNGSAPTGPAAGGVGGGGGSGSGSQTTPGDVLIAAGGLLVGGGSIGGAAKNATAAASEGALARGSGTAALLGWGMIGLGAASNYLIRHWPGDVPISPDVGAYGGRIRTINFRHIRLH